MTRLICVSLYSRDGFSVGNMRRVFEHEAYHWAIMVTPEISTGRDCFVYEATDASTFDPVTFRLDNPTMDWFFRPRSVNPDLSSKMLGRIVVGQVPEDVDLYEIFKSVPLPIKNQDPQQSCVTWVTNAIRALQSRKLVREFELGAFKDWALLYADDRMKRDQSMEPKVKHYHA